MSFNPAVLLPIGIKLGELVRSGIEQYAVLRSAGGEVTADALAAFVLVKMEGWTPTAGGRRILTDPETRAAFARALAGIAFDIARGA